MQRILREAFISQTELLKSHYAKIFVELLAQYNLDPHELIRESGLPADLDNIEDQFLPVEPIRRLLFLIANQSGIVQFGDILRTAIVHSFVPKVLPYFTSFHSVREALEASNAIYRCDSIGTFVGLEETYGRNWYFRYKDFEDDELFLWTEVYAALFTIELIRVFTRSDWIPKQIKTQSDHVDIYKAIIGDSVQYFVGQEKLALLIEDEILDHSIVRATNQSISNEPAVIWHANFTDQVYTALLPYVKEHNLSVAQAAKLLKLSPRTFQRRLKEENTNFRRLKDNLMFSASVELIEQGMSFTHIASQLGYSDIAHFSRAFKRISGLTPKLYRRCILGDNES